MVEKFKRTKKLISVEGRLRELVELYDHKGKVIHKILNPLMMEFQLRDLVQLIVGSALLAIPVGFTEEVWTLSSSLPMLNVGIIFFVSLLFIGLFVYYSYYRGFLSKNLNNFIKRVSFTYFVSFFIVALFLTLIGKGFFSVESTLAVKRVILVAFPASMSAAVADMIK